ncbi:tRNA U-34 5-methylaminomethyl-2-thiouridine biosynthesis protein [Phaeobacter sp. 11ANDIMAR09]|uniref:DODA-type extradiol aromatic ring-opening family dioxygenase n=1 Tax=Phaeobacter sp. 11ANDIMAR09 TaxID=1225647 RepID=UPI0006C8DE14|nr:tRNA U-34 5-methylaminomethyl-2-thiouridine biosynthesis protein [Phaeobacter sp. 11ANDIMAR09]KPD11064.1 tRNA U-34 5-methylaminomethyl-2-thiouridine biosynthesis protein [Phaeobacter sp. 11ANDIMAR09]
MTVVSAFLVPGSPLPLLRSENPPWSGIASAYRTAGRALAASRPDTILLYSTQWMAVLDELWQARPHLADTHVDENWYEYGDLEYDLNIDVELAQACVAGSKEIGISSKAIDYDKFPIDTGTIVADKFLNPSSRYPLTIAANNLYHSFDDTIRLGEMAVQKATDLGRRVAIVGVGGLSGSIFRHEIDIRSDGIVSAEDDAWNRQMLSSLEAGGDASFPEVCDEFAKGAKADMGFKHCAWIYGALGRKFSGARVHEYGATYGSGAAVVEFKV